VWPRRPARHPTDCQADATRWTVTAAASLAHAGRDRAHLVGSVAAVECRQWCARDLAREFHRFLQAQPGLVGAAIRWEWIYASYPLFCRWLRVGRPPPYKDFARELALIMPRKRKDPRQGGKRLGAFTVYIVEPLEKPGQQGVSDVTETLERRLRG
jgi:hypothetical protein